jgi:DNA-binding PadR family transcriptional regulator
LPGRFRPSPEGQRDFHGYEIAKHLGDETDRRLLTAYGTLYRALSRLEKMGLLKSRWENPQIAADENRPGRRLYKLTKEGERAGGRCRHDDQADRGDGDPRVDACLHVRHGPVSAQRTPCRDRLGSLGELSRSQQRE